MAFLWCKSWCGILLNSVPEIPVSCLLCLLSIRCVKLDWVPACPLLCLSSWLSQSTDLLTSFRGQRHSRGLDLLILFIFNIQVWSYLVASLSAMAVLVRQWSCTHPPLVNIVSCRTCRTLEMTTPWRGWWSVEELTPLHPASHLLMPAGRQQLTC